MAIMRSEGLEAINKQMEDLGMMFDDNILRELLTASGEKSKQAWISQIIARTQTHHHYLAGSIKTGKLAKSKDGASIIIYPQGNRGDDGKRNAEIAFILNYSSRYPRQNGFVEIADIEAEPQIIATMEQIINRFIQSHGGK